MFGGVTDTKTSSSSLGVMEIRHLGYANIRGQDYNVRATGDACCGSLRETATG